MTRIDIEEFIDNQRIGTPQVMVLLVCGLVCFIDGFDMFMIGKIAPAIAEGFGQPPEAMANLFVWQQIAMAVGAFVVSPLADRIGRQRMLMISCGLFGLFTLASVWSQTLAQLTVLRALASVFMAAGLPMALALISEAAPARRRATFVALSLVGYSTGNAASGAVAAWLLDDYGWQSAFWIGGIAPLVCIPLLAFFVPESLKFRAERNPNDPRIGASLRKLDRQFMVPEDAVFVLGKSGGEARKAKLTDIFTEGRGLMTGVLWAACLISMTSIALTSQWLPTFFQEMAGVPIQQFAVSALIGYMGSIAGTLLIGYLMDRFRATRMIPLFYIGLFAAFIGMAWVSFEAQIFILILIAFNFLQTGGQAGLNTLITKIYPPRMRSTALGWAGGAGRVGGVLAPIYGGYAVAQDFSLQLTLGIAALLPFTVALLVLVLGRVIRTGKAVLAPDAGQV
ncbi:MFS transporter [Alteraurantiacibacter buctensis]|uniref:MFS transporter n=1 Tax=Alteraurantiacibacter buctensis TaxID=1503981 RepID=A0A844YYQ1_9SPHN|nr:MFS transporter [Alteraurantiacibacter buctensis]MXO72168.1 MFS transporter [Alteraurantiacibacter buctensis]